MGMVLTSARPGMPGWYRRVKSSEGDMLGRRALERWCRSVSGNHGGIWVIAGWGCTRNVRGNQSRIQSWVGATTLPDPLGRLHWSQVSRLTIRLTGDCFESESGEKSNRNWFGLGGLSNLHLAKRGGIAIARIQVHLKLNRPPTFGCAPTPPLLSGIVTHL